MRNNYKFFLVKIKELDEEIPYVENEDRENSSGGRKGKAGGANGGGVDLRRLVRQQMGLSVLEDKDSLEPLKVPASGLFGNTNILLLSWKNNFYFSTEYRGGGYSV